MTVGIGHLSVGCSAPAAFVIGSSHGTALRGQARVMRAAVRMDSNMGVILENVVNVLEGELVSKDCSCWQ